MTYHNFNGPHITTGQIYKCCDTRWNEAHLIQNKEGIETERETTVAFGRTGGGHNTSNLEETMERMKHSPHLDAHDPDSQLPDSTWESSKVLLALDEIPVSREDQIT
jgi:hypothetical protein